jgi:hypothetical protein
MPNLTAFTKRNTRPAIVAQMGGADPEVTDRLLVDGLAALLGRFPTLRTTEVIDPQYGYDFAAVGYDLGRLDEDQWREAQTLMAPALEPASPRIVAEELARLRAVTKARSISEPEAAMMFGALRQELSEFPPDVVRGALRKIARRETFFPALAEVRDQCQREFRNRRLLAEALGFRKGGDRSWTVATTSTRHCADTSTASSTCTKTVTR